MQGPGQRNPVWRHNAGAINNFYNVAGGSGFSVSFNQSPSQNKILKSVSVEGTNNSDPAVVIIANNSTTANQRKESPASGFEDKGGILYSPIRGQINNTTGNIKKVGDFYFNDPDNPPLFNPFGTSLQVLAPFIWADGGQSNVSANSRYFLLPPGGAADPFTSDVNSNVRNFLNGNYESFPTDITQFQYVPDDGTAGIIVTNLQDNTQFGLDLGDRTILSLYSVTPNFAYGDMLKGQYADAVFLCGNNDWEIFSVNLEYEPVSYDHNSSATPSVAGRRRRRR